MTSPNAVDDPIQLDADPLDESAPATDAAPWGYKPDGTPRRSAGGRPRGGTNRRRTSTTTRTRAPQAPSRKSAGARPKTPDYRAGVTGLLTLVALPLRYSGPAGPLDAATVMLMADEFGSACQSTAEQDARFAAVLDRAMSIGPYGAIVGCALRFGAQLAENHRWLPTQVTQAMGAVPRDELAAQLAAHVGDQAAA